MELIKREIRAYQTIAGRSPFDDWFEGLWNRRAAQWVRTRLARLRAGNFGDCHALGSGLFELRIHYGPGYRIYFAQCRGYVIVVLCGGEKTTQTRDIAKARVYWQDYQRKSHEALH